MLKIKVPACGEQYDEVNNRFLPATKEQTLALEHSLVSISKWEAKWHRSFINKGPETTEEWIDYVRCMTLTQNVDPNVYTALTKRNFSEISAYIKEPMTATTFPKKNGRQNREIITAEIIYYWMFSYGISMECQKWHLNKLITLINVFNSKNAPPKKMSQKEIMAQNRALNAARRRRLGSSG